MGTPLAQATKLYRFTKPDIFSDEIRSQLPQAYKNFYKEWKMTTPAPVHYIPKAGKWQRDPNTGIVTAVQNVPMPLKFPKESNKHLWGGEGVVQGFQNRKKYVTKIPHFWVPALKKSVVYSEILDKWMSVIVTNTTINLVIENNGFDNYILQTPACDLQSLLALKLKRKMLMSLYNKDLYMDNPARQEEVYNKYKNYLEPYSREDLEWYGLSLREAVRKMSELKETPKPLKHKFRTELITKLCETEMNAVEKEDENDRLDKRSSWLSKLNPFSKS